MATPHRLDVHAHIVPDIYLDALERAGISTSGGIPYPKWSPDIARGLMDRHGIAAQITSVSSPGVYFGDVSLARALARLCNDFSARLVSDDPTRFGAFAHVPLPDIDAAIEEAEYALGTLKLDGIVLMASIGETFLGDPAFDPFFEALNARKAVVFVHPTMHPSTKGLKLGLPGFMVEFLFDTTRAATNMVFNGTLEKFPDLKIILSHAGGTIPFVPWRLDMGSLIDPRIAKKVPRGFSHWLRQFYFDTALSASAAAMGPLKALVDPSRILFGSDWPYAPEPVTAKSVAALPSLGVFSPGEMQGVERGHALKLFPRFGTGTEGNS